MDGLCQPCGVAETVLWACQSCWRKHRRHSCFSHVPDRFKVGPGTSKRETNMPVCLCARNILISIGLLQQRARQPYRSCCCRQAFMSLTWRRWEDMSVDSTISITRDRSSLEAEHTDTQFNSWPWIIEMNYSGWGVIIQGGGTYQGCTLFRFPDGFACSHGNAGCCKSQFQYAVGVYLRDICRAPPFITQSHNTSVIRKASINIQFYAS